MKKQLTDVLCEKQVALQTQAAVLFIPDEFQAKNANFPKATERLSPLSREPAKF